MSTDLRAQALAGAIQAGGPGDQIIENAALFLAFLEGNSAAIWGRAEVTEPKKPAKPKAEPKPVVVEPTGPTLDDVKSKLNELLSANKRNEAVALFAEFSAKNASGVKDGDRAAFIEKADAILMAD